MPENIAQNAPASVVRTFPSAPNRRTLTVQELVDAYMAAYAGRDKTRGAVLAVWCGYLGAQIASELDEDTIADVWALIADEPVRRYMGKSDCGTAQHRQFGRKSPATLNRYKCAFSGVLSWGKQRRLMPRGWRNPCREITNLPENNCRVRFLTADERDRLLKLCRLSSWSKLYLLVLMAITTGARRGELLGLHHRDIDLESGRAYLERTKNGERRVLILLPAVVEEIRRHGREHPDALLFASRFNPAKAMSVKKPWDDALALARIENFRFHDLRHDCASQLAQQGASLLEIANVLGHKSLAMSARYSHLTTDSKAALVSRVLGGLR
jgi:integrase